MLHQLLTLMGAALHVGHPLAHSKLVGVGSQLPIGQCQVISRVIIEVSTKTTRCIVISRRQLHPHCTRKVKGDLSQCGI